MKKFIVGVCVFGLMFMSSGCSKTWNGVKKDSDKAWKSTKKVVHDASA
jgi:starvation-inducible outer membrane lipoprotein